MSLKPEEKAAEPKAVAEAASTEKEPFSWRQPHALFVVLLVGPEPKPVPFAIQKDLLCDRSEFYRKYCEEHFKNDKVEKLVRIPDTTLEAFGFVQNYLYTGKIDTEAAGDISFYSSLIDVWKLGHSLEIKGLCDRILEAMATCRQLTGRIPSTPLLTRVWRETPEGSSIRVLLLSWAAEFMRSSDHRAEFAKSLPQEVLSELVVAMTTIQNILPAQQAPPTPAPALPVTTLASVAPTVVAPPPVTSQALAAGIPRATASGIRKNVHYLEGFTDEEPIGTTAKRNRRSSGISAEPAQPKRSNRKSGPSPLQKGQKRRSSAAHLESRTYSTQQRLDFCADLLARMLSGPGFWTRLVGPFKQPVHPKDDGVPDYFEKIKKPMDLGTIKMKMDRKEYVNDEEFLVDVRQIFENCFTYWNKGDPMWDAGEKLQKSFEDKFSDMNKWISKMGGDEGD